MAKKEDKWKPMFYEFGDSERKDEIKQAFLASHITRPGVMLLLVARYSFAPTAQILIAGFYLASLHDSL